MGLSMLIVVGMALVAVLLAVLWLMSWVFERELAADILAYACWFGVVISMVA